MCVLQVIIISTLTNLTFAMFFQNFIFVYLQRQLETLGAQRAGLEDMLKDMSRKVCLILVDISLYSS